MCFECEMNGYGSCTKTAHELFPLGILTKCPEYTNASEIGNWSETICDECRIEFPGYCAIRAREKQEMANNELPEAVTPVPSTSPHEPDSGPRCPWYTTETGLCTLCEIYDVGHCQLLPRQRHTIEEQRRQAGNGLFNSFTGTRIGKTAPEEERTPVDIRTPVQKEARRNIASSTPGSEKRIIHCMDEMQRPGTICAECEIYELGWCLRQRCNQGFIAQRLVQFNCKVTSPEPGEPTPELLGNSDEDEDASRELEDKEDNWHDTSMDSEGNTAADLRRKQREWDREHQSPEQIKAAKFSPGKQISAPGIDPKLQEQLDTYIAEAIQQRHMQHPEEPETVAVPLTRNGLLVQEARIRFHGILHHQHTGFESAYRGWEKWLARHQDLPQDLDKLIALFDTMEKEIGFILHPESWPESDKSQPPWTWEEWKEISAAFTDTISPTSCRPVYKFTPDLYRSMVQIFIRNGSKTRDWIALTRGKGWEQINPPPGTLDITPESADDSVEEADREMENYRKLDRFVTELPAAENTATRTIRDELNSLLPSTPKNSGGLKTEPRGFAERMYDIATEFEITGTNHLSGEQNVTYKKRSEKFLWRLMEEEASGRPRAPWLGWKAFFKENPGITGNPTYRMRGTPANALMLKALRAQERDTMTNRIIEKLSADRRSTTSAPGKEAHQRSVADRLMELQPVLRDPGNPGYLDTQFQTRARQFYRNQVQNRSYNDATQLWEKLFAAALPVVKLADREPPAKTLAGGMVFRRFIDKYVKTPVPASDFDRAETRQRALTREKSLMDYQEERCKTSSTHPSYRVLREQTKKETTGPEQQSRDRARVDNSARREQETRIPVETHPENLERPAWKRQRYWAAENEINWQRAEARQA